MSALFEQLRRVLCCNEEDGHHHRQTERNPSHGDRLLEQIGSDFGSSPTDHYDQERELSQPLTVSPPSLSPRRVRLVVNNPWTGYHLIGLQNEPKFGMTVDELITGRLSQSSHGTSPSASGKSSHFASKPFTFSSSDPFVSPAKPPLTSPPLKQYLALVPQTFGEPSSSRLQCPSSTTSLPTPKAEQRRTSSPIAKVGQHSSHSAKQCKPVLSPAIIQTKPTSVFTDSNKYVPNSETSHSLLPNTNKPSSLEFTPPSSSSSTCHVVVHNLMTREPIRPKNEPNLGRTVSGLTQSSDVTSPFQSVPLTSPKPSPSVSKASIAPSSNPSVSPAQATAISAYSNQCVSKSTESSNEPSSSRLLHPSLSKTSSPTPSLSKAVPSASPKPSPSVLKPLTATCSDPFVSPAKPAAVAAPSNQYVLKSSQSSKEPSLARLLHASLSTASSATPQVQQHSSPIPEPYKWVERPVVSEIKLPPPSAHSNQNVAKPSRPSNELSSSRVQSPSSSKTISPTPKGQERSAKQYKPVLRAVSPVRPNQQKKTVYIRKDASPIYNIPKDIEDLIERGIAPGILQKPLSPSTYRDYFAALLYAEDFYIEKWSDFILKNVTLELQQLDICRNVWDKDLSSEEVCVNFVKFKMESIPERRPFLLSRDFVFAKPLDKQDVQFQGCVYRVEKWSVVLAEFGNDFLSQHQTSSRYDISFSSNRVCLKRAHQAVEAATDPSFHNFLFPERTSGRDVFALPSLYFSNNLLYPEQRSAIRQILTLKGSAPFLMEGPLCTCGRGLSRAGVVVREAVSQIYRCSKDPRILVAAPINKTCDALMRSLKYNDTPKIPDSEIFRANAAFREYDGVPEDILPSCLYKEKSECFACPPLQELRRFKIIFSTFVSSFRLHNEGINAGHFSHIFLVDASSTSEPEAMIVLANLANDDTTVIVTGARGNRSGWVRSPIARKNGLRISYFERLKELTPYKELDPAFIARLDPEPESDESNSCLSY